MLEWYIKNEILINFIMDAMTIVGFITTFYAIIKIVSYIKTRKLQNKINEMRHDKQLYDAISYELEEYIGTGDHDYSIRLVYYKNYPNRLEKDNFRKFLFWYKFSKKHIPCGYASNTSISTIDEVSSSGDKIYYNNKTHKWFIDRPKKHFKKYQELPHDMIIYHLPFQNIIDYRFGTSDWTDKHEPVFFTKYKFNSRKLFRDDIIAVLMNQYRFPSNQLTLSKAKQIKWRKILHKIKTNYTHTRKRRNNRT